MVVLPVFSETYKIRVCINLKKQPFFRKELFHFFKLFKDLVKIHLLKY